ncbi:MAG: class I SAM-dependent methyltransferase [Methylococcaceae bacterium]|nr:class I SAM-dependent methyltransferase [Methylococcaceae bacterium]
MTSNIADMANDPSGYDAIPYYSQAFAQSHPDRLASIARIFGLTPPDIARCRVLELGCAAGGNLIPMAYALPDSEFVGVDLSAAQVESGRRTIVRLGLNNVRIEQASILDIDESWGNFDYLICHGVFSWVPPEVRDKILRIASRQLGEQGVAYISYNTYPGWNIRGTVRHMLGYHATPDASPAERVAQARRLLDQLVTAMPQEGDAYAQMFTSEVERLRVSEDWYLYHEVLEPNNEPMYFHQFIEYAQNAGLQYLAEAEFSNMLTLRLPQPMAQALHEMSRDILQFEQNLDFMRNRHFRQTLLCKAGARPHHALSADSLAGLYIASGAQAEPAIDLRPGVAVNFRIKGGAQGATDNPLTKAALGLLAQRWPLGWAVDELFDAACEQAAPWLPDSDPAMLRTPLAHDLLQCFLSGLIDLHSWQPPCVSQVSALPVASAWAVDEAAERSLVTNLRHEVINLVPFSRALLTLLDGRRSRVELLDELTARVAAGTLTLPQADPSAPDDPVVLRAHVGVWLDDSLTRLARYALLTA